MQRHDRTGRSKAAKLSPEAQWVQLHNGFRKEASWQALSFGARITYIELKGAFNGSNNGRIMASVRFLAEQIGCAKATVERALSELQDAGFIVKTKGGALGVDGKGTGSCWRLTELGCLGERPTQDYKSRFPSSRLGQDVLKTRTGKAATVPETRTGCPRNEDRKPPKSTDPCPRNEDDLQSYHGGSDDMDVQASTVDQQQHGPHIEAAAASGQFAAGWQPRVFAGRAPEGEVVGEPAVFVVRGLRSK